ncbi:MAG: hypothetical protein ACREKL_11630, partial [Chthoniobacterales bacterium]
MKTIRLQLCHHESDWAKNSENTGKHRLRLVLLFSCVLLHAAPAFAGIQTWSDNPGTGDWNTPANWLGGTVPNGIADVATFDSSSVTGVSISANTGVNGIVFNAG